MSSYLEPRGLAVLTEKLRAARWRAAATGSLAAQRLAPIAATHTAAVYVDDAASAADRFKLRPTDRGANVLLIEPFDDVVFERTMVHDGLVTASPMRSRPIS